MKEEDEGTFTHVKHLKSTNPSNPVSFALF